MLVYLKDGSAQTILHAATLRQKLQIKLSNLPNHSILTPGQPVPALTLWCQVPGRVATGVPIFKSLVWLNPEKSWCKRDSNTISSALEADTLTTRSRRQFFIFYVIFFHWGRVNKGKAAHSSKRLHGVLWLDKMCGKSCSTQIVLCGVGWGRWGVVEINWIQREWLFPL